MLILRGKGARVANVVGCGKGSNYRCSHCTMNSSGLNSDKQQEHLLQIHGVEASGDPLCIDGTLVTASFWGQAETDMLQ